MNVRAHWLTVPALSVLFAGVVLVLGWRWMATTVDTALDTLLPPRP